MFAKHAYPKKFPAAQAVCPHCGDISEIHHDADHCECYGCCKSFDPQRGPALGQKAACPCCAHEFPIAKTIRERGQPPSHRLYAKLVLRPDGRKTYERATAFDHALFAAAEAQLADRVDAFPVVPIAAGYNTDQALGYNYRHWHEMFNARQLLSLAIIADRVRTISDPVLRDLFTCLFSGALEFNNLFASYKGEGTGAVRHMFAHHILKPERVPLEANVWGTSKSSGSFSTMFEGRIRRALDYADAPFELTVIDKGGKKAGDKVFGLSGPMGYRLADSYGTFGPERPVYLSCGDSSETDLADQSVDAVLTDLPFFDNVHYSQLADFFHVWQRHILGNDGLYRAVTTRSEAEVQHSDVDTFTTRLGGVWREAHRVLKDEGLLAFTYHHSRADGWRSVLQALMESGFGITAVQPIKSEMSVAMPKHQAKEPIDLDIIVVCRKRGQLSVHPWNGGLWEAVTPPVESQVSRLACAGRRLSRNDVRIIVMAQLLRQLSLSDSAKAAVVRLDETSAEAEAEIARLYALSEQLRAGRG